MYANIYIHYENMQGVSNLLTDFSMSYQIRTLAAHCFLSPLRAVRQSLYANHIITVSHTVIKISR